MSRATVRLPRLPLFVLALWVAQACASPGQGGSSGEVGDAGGGGSSSSSGGSSGGGSSGGSSSGASSGSGSSSGGGSGGVAPNDAGAGSADTGATDAANAQADSAGSGGGDATTGQGCSGLPLCDDFDSAGDTAGSPPSAAVWTLLGTAGCGGTGNSSAPTIYPIVVDNTQFHSPPNSVKITGGDSCGPLMINTAALAKIARGEVYGRFYVHLSDTTTLVHHAVLMALGFLRDGGVGLNINDYNSFLELAPEAQGGLSTTTLTWQTTDSDHLPNTDSTGAMTSTYLPAAGFACVEFHTSANTNAIETWINGNVVAGLTSPPSPPSANPPMWSPPSPLAPTSLGVGWMSFAQSPMTAWFDDVALSSTRIGCQ